jgi:hypothetical protein
MDEESFVQVNRLKRVFVCGVVYLCQRLNMATSSRADDAYHYVIPQKLLDAIFNKLPVFMHQREKDEAILYPVEVPPP